MSCSVIILQVIISYITNSLMRDIWKDIPKMENVLEGTRTYIKHLYASDASYLAYFRKWHSN